MQAKTVWQYGSSNPENGDNLQIIRQWWGRFANEKVSWQQRLIPESGDLEAIDWEAQRFDEEFVLTSPSLRGITLYWHKPDSRFKKPCQIAQREQIVSKKNTTVTFRQSLAQKACHNVSMNTRTTA